MFQTKHRKQHPSGSDRRDQQIEKQVTVSNGRLPWTLLVSFIFVIAGSLSCDLLDEEDDLTGDVEQDSERDSEQDSETNDETGGTDGVSYEMTDAQGNSYSALSIGSQIWMTENLRVTVLNDGTPIEEVTELDSWDDLGSVPGYCWYDDDAEGNGVVYGALYNWHTVNTGMLCPDGWHVPAMEEWEVLKSYVGSKGFDGVEGRALKATTLWEDYEGAAGTGTDDFGFHGLGGGMRGYMASAEQAYSLNQIGHWWSTTSFNDDSAYAYELFYNLDEFRSEHATWKVHGISVRCVKDGK